MELWFDEMHTQNMRLGFRIVEELEHVRTKFQDIHIFETLEYGKLMVIDGTVQLTERDEFIYHEMIVHPAMLTHPSPKKILIIGGGDGGSAREALKHEPEEVHVVEIDEAVVNLSKKYFPQVASAYLDSRVSIHFEDGVEFIKRAGKYDVVIIDSTDPVGPATGLFQEDFYRNIKGILSAEGVVVQQCGTPIYHPEEVCGVLKNMGSQFRYAKLYLAFIPTYPSGMWAFSIASDSPLEMRREIGFKTRYFTRELYLPPLPKFVEENCNEER